LAIETSKPLASITGRDERTCHSADRRLPSAKPPHQNRFWEKMAPSRHQVEILRKCLTDTAIGELMAIAGRSDRTKFRNPILKPLLETGWLEMTRPDHPNSRLQKYRITPAGRDLLRDSNQT